jgi:hypothetical protein
MLYNKFYLIMFSKASNSVVGTLTKSAVMRLKSDLKELQKWLSW